MVVIWQLSCIPISNEAVLLMEIKTFDGKVVEPFYAETGVTGVANESGSNPEGTAGILPMEALYRARDFFASRGVTNFVQTVHEHDCLTHQQKRFEEEGMGRPHLIGAVGMINQCVHEVKRSLFVLAMDKFT